MPRPKEEEMLQIALATGPGTPPVWGAIMGAQRTAAENTDGYRSRKREVTAAHGMGKDKGRFRHGREKMVANRFQIRHIILKTFHMGDGGIGNAIRAPGSTMTTLIIGQDGIMIMKEREDELRILEGIFGKPMNDNDRSDGIIGTV